MSKKPVAIVKRARISKAQQQMMLITLATSLLLGVSIVLFNYLSKLSGYNSRVLDAQDKSINSYEDAIKKVGICKDSNNDGHYSNEELKKCDPNNLAPDEVKDSLRYKALVEMALNPELESVTRDGLIEACYEGDQRIDYFKKQAAASDDNSRHRYADLAKRCSALRVMPEALPFSGVKENPFALMASLNKIMLMSNWRPEKIAPIGEAVAIDVPGLGFMPAKFTIDAEPAIIHNIIENIERSIRTFDINVASISWSKNGKVSFSVDATAYYSENETLPKKTGTVRFNDSAPAKNTKKKAGKK